MHRFLPIYNLPTLIQRRKRQSEKTCGKLGAQSIIKEIPGPDGLTIEFYKTFETNINLSQTLSENWIQNTATLKGLYTTTKQDLPLGLERWLSS